MAASFPVQPEDLRCPMCLQLYVHSRYPKDLDCQHACCQDCLFRLISGGNPSITCPECRRVTNIPRAGVESMNTNMTLRGFAEERYELELQKTGTGMCTSHEKEELRFYCETCDMLICPLCLIDKHRRNEHDVKSLNDKRKECKIQMKHAIYEAELEAESCEKSETELLKVKLQLDTAIKLQESRIDSRVESIVAEIRKKGQDLKHELRRLEKPRFERILKERAHLTERRKNLKSALESAKSKVDTALDFEYMMQHEQLLSSVTELLNDPKPITISRNTTVVTFEPAISESEISLGKLEKPKISPKKPRKGGRPVASPRYSLLRRNSTGSVPSGINVILDRKNRSTTLREWKAGGLARRCRTLESVDQFGRFQSAKSVDISASGLVAVWDQNSKQVHIYESSEDGQYKVKFKVQLLSDNTHKPQMVAFTKDEKILVARWTAVEVYTCKGEYESSFNTRQIQKRRFRSSRAVEEKDTGVVSIATTPNGKRILVGNIERSTITVHDATGTIIMKSIQVNIKPWHLATNGRHIAFSQWSANSVSVHDLESSLLLFSVLVRGPRGMCFDEETGSILVSKDNSNVYSGNRTVDQYCSSTGQWIGQAAIGLHGPHDVCFNADGSLMVADYKSVKICSETETYV